MKASITVHVAVKTTIYPIFEASDSGDHPRRGHITITAVCI